MGVSGEGKWRSGGNCTARLEFMSDILKQPAMSAGAAARRKVGQRLSRYRTD